MTVDYDFLADLARDYEYQYLVEELYGKLVANKLSQEFDIYIAFDERNKYFICDSIGFKIRFYDVKDFRQLHDIIEEQIGDGVEDAKADLDTNSVKVEYDPDKVTDADLVGAVKEAGFDVE